jgi:methionine synthase II (cobalamin-independent)
MIDKLLPITVVAANLDPGLLLAMSVISVEQFIVAPDCGFKQMSHDIAFTKIQVVQGAVLVRDAL